MILVGLAWHEAYSFSIWHMPEIKKILTFYDHNFILLGITSLHCGNKAGFRFHASKRPHLMTADYWSVVVKLRILSCPYLQKTGQLRSLNIKEFKNVPIITMGKLCTKGQLSYIKAIYDYCPSRIHVGGHHTIIYSLKNAPPRVGLEPTTVVILFTVHHSNQLRHGEMRFWQKLAGFYCTATELLALCYRLCWFWLVGWPKPIWHKLSTIWSTYML